MKRLIVTLLLILLAFTVVACGSEKPAEPQQPAQAQTSAPAQEPATEPSTEQESEQEPEEEPEEEPKNNSNTIETAEYKYVINGYEIIDNAMFEDKKILALRITFTNSSDEPANVWMTQGFKAEQETDTTIEVLMGANGQFPEDYNPELVKNGSDVDIKPGATIEVIIGYDLLDPEKPVYLRPFFGSDFEIVVNE